MGIKFVLRKPVAGHHIPISVVDIATSVSVMLPAGGSGSITLNPPDFYSDDVPTELVVFIRSAGGYEFSARLQAPNGAYLSQTLNSSSGRLTFARAAYISGTVLYLTNLNPTYAHTVSVNYGYRQ